MFKSATRKLGYPYRGNLLLLDTTEIGLSFFFSTGVFFDLALVTT